MQREALEHQEKKSDDAVTVKIPRGFFDFVYSKPYSAFMESLLDYLRELFHLENTYAELAKEAKENGIQPP